MAGVFEDLFVLDLSWGIAGPMTTMMLADGGANVTRIESPDGDPSADPTGWRVWNRGKRSATLDLRAADELATFRRMASEADILVESFSPGTMSRLGASHDELARVNPRLITCSISAYGSSGRHHERPGYDGLVAARTGLLYDQRGRRGTAMEYLAGRPGPLPEFDAPEGRRRGTSRSGPIFPRTPWPSLGAAYLATLGTTAALRARELTGEGQHVHTSLLEGALAAVCLNWQRVENPDAAPVLDVADGLPLDRGALRVRRRPLGAPLDGAAPLGAGRRRGRRTGAVAHRGRLPRRPRPGLDGARRDADRELPLPDAGRSVQEVPERRLGGRR